MQLFLAKNKIPNTTQPQYSPDLAPFEFWLFPSLKMQLNNFLRWRKFNKTTADLTVIPERTSRGASSNRRTIGVCMAEGQSFKSDSVSFCYVPFLFRIMPEFQELSNPPTIYKHTVFMSALPCYMLFQA
jgi:hypothetical protein